MEDDEMVVENIEEEAAGDTIEAISNEELQNRLNQAIENEDYELASKIRDEINKREA